MARIGKSAPWIVFYRELEALFANDPTVRVIFDEESTAVSLYVEDAIKAEALNQLLPMEKKFGNVILKVKVVPANVQKNLAVDGNLFEVAFQGNPALSYVRTVSGIFSNALTYVVFQKKVVQYYTDNLGDIHGITSTLYQDIAEEVFGKKDGVFYCTDVADACGGILGAPLGEWP